MARGRGRGAQDRAATSAVAAEPRPQAIVVAPPVEAAVAVEVKTGPVLVEEERLYGGLTAEKAIKRVQMTIWRFEERKRVLLASKPQALDSGAALLQLDVDAAGIISANEQRHLVAAAQAGHEQSRRLLTVCNQRAVHKWCSRYQGQGLDLEELIQEGSLGLQKAIDKYSWDYADSASFLTYAAWWVRQSVSQAIQERGGQFAVPNYLHLVKTRVQQSKKALEARGIASPTREQLIAEVQARSNKPVPEDHIDAAIELTNRRFSSLDRQIGEEDGSATLASVIADEDIDMEENLRHEGLRRALTNGLGNLSPLQRTIITRRYGLEGMAPTTGTDLQQELGMTKGSLDNALKRALQALEPAFRAEGLTSISSL